MHTTESLIKTGAAGLGLLFEQERMHLRRFLERRINRRIASRLDASDVIQDVYVRAQQALPSYISNPVVPPLVWLRHLGAQVLCEVHRKQFREVRSPFREDNQTSQFLVLSLAKSSMSISSQIERKEIQSKILEQLAELSQIDREVLEMRHVDGYSLVEISQILNMNLETIKKRYYRALKRFKDVIGHPVKEE